VLVIEPVLEQKLAYASVEGLDNVHENHSKGLGTHASHPLGGAQKMGRLSCATSGEAAELHGACGLFESRNQPGTNTATARFANL
jgi:hypothetical protein